MPEHEQADKKRAEIIKQQEDEKNAEYEARKNEEEFANYQRLHQKFSNDGKEKTDVLGMAE